MNFDFEINNQGAISIVVPMNEDAREWLTLHTQFCDNALYEKFLVVEHRYLEDLVEGMRYAGFLVKS